ncbi:MAG TPA: class I SAM-dependent methyltransferase [Burkholderiaceae bacterium]|nr:class I SAM-dependent methyltransferase [Burkholderiaceae bacterium]
MTDAAPYQFTTDWFDIYARRIWPDLLARLQPARVLEIGSYEGAAVCFLIEQSAAQPSIEIHCVDTWGGGIEHQSAGVDMAAVEARFLHNVNAAVAGARHTVDVRVHKQRSDLALAQLLTQRGPGSFDFIYVDGSHQAADVLCDAVLAFRLLRVGGVLAFDDYLWAEDLPQGRDPLRCPKPAIDAFVNLHFPKLDILRLPVAYQLYVQKRSD